MKWLDRYFDKVVYEDGRSVVAIAGNTGGNVTSPGLGWNVITVGGIDDMDTAERADDDRYPASGYIDPESLHHDRNKPEVSAVAERIQSTETSSYGQWITRTDDKNAGTSYATPAVAGMIAMLDTCSLSCFAYPQQYKSIIMASAIHDAYGAEINDDMEGVGTVDALMAWELVNNNFLDSSTVCPTCSWDKYFNTVKGEKVRFVICWCSHTNWDVDESYDVLETDFDLEIRDPQGHFVGSSCSYDNNYEVVEFVAPMSGEYRALIQRIGGGEEEVVACAWSRRLLGNIFVNMFGWWFADEPEVFHSSSTPIQDAVDHANAGYGIAVYPGTYAENVEVWQDHLTIRSLSGNPEDTSVYAANHDWNVFTVHAPYVTISGFTVTGANEGANGILLGGAGADNCIISNNIITNNDVGICVDGSSNNVITNNDVSNNDECGIYMDCGGHNNTISNSDVLDNNYGICMGHSLGGTATGNFVSGNEYGIWIGGRGVRDWTLTENYVTENSLDDIHVCSGSSNIAGDDNICDTAYGYCDDSVYFGPPYCVYQSGLTGPDLWLAEFDVAWVPGQEGEYYTIDYTVCNMGNQAAGASSTGIYINGFLQQHDPTPGLLAFSCDYPVTVGPYGIGAGEIDTVKVCADDLDVVTETWESNNCRERRFGGSDLVIRDFDQIVWVDKPYKRYNLTYYIENLGDVATPAQCWTNFTCLDSDGGGWDCIDPVPVPAGLQPGHRWPATEIRSVGPVVMGNGSDWLQGFVNFEHTFEENVWGDLHGNCERFTADY